MSAQLIRFCERLAREGYRVIAPDFFSRSHGVDPTDFGAIIGVHHPREPQGRLRRGRRRPPGARGVEDRRHRVLHGWVVHVPRRQVGRRPRRRRRGAVLRWRHRPRPRRRALPDAHVLRRPRRLHPDGRHRGGQGAATATPSSCTPAPSTASCATARRTTTRRRPPTRGHGCSRSSASTSADDRTRDCSGEAEGDDHEDERERAEQVEARRDDRDPVVVGIESRAGTRRPRRRSPRAPRTSSRSRPPASTPRSSRGCPGS